MTARHDHIVRLVTETQRRCRRCSSTTTRCFCYFQNKRKIQYLVASSTPIIKILILFIYFFFFIKIIESKYPLCIKQQHGDFQRIVVKAKQERLLFVTQGLHTFISLSPSIRYPLFVPSFLSSSTTQYTISQIPLGLVSLLCFFFSFLLYLRTTQFFFFFPSLLLVYTIPEVMIMT